MTKPDTPSAAETPDVIEEVDRLITEFQRHSDPEVRERVGALLSGIDAVHRAALTHLIEAIRGMAGDAFINRLVSDPAIRLLFMSYDLVTVDRRLMAEEALDAERGPLHDHGVDVEITEVVGGVVYIRLHGLASSGMDEADVLARLEARLREDLAGFQQLVPDTARRQTSSPLISMDALRGAHRPVYRAVAASADVQEGQLRAVDVDGVPVLMTRVGGNVVAVRNRCGDTPLPLQFSELSGAELRCSWHGCRYDVRTGHRLDREGARLQVFPVAIEEDMIRIAIDVEPNK
jgi:nitrite reductase/ring-hydroxylating ferredoxin subunit